MLKHRTIQKTGSLIVGLLFATKAYASVQFTASVDQRKISADQSVSLSLSLNYDSSSRVSEPQYDAPDFEQVSHFSSTTMNVQMDSQTGRFITVNSQRITKVLHPNKEGELKISNIRVSVNGNVLKAPDIVIQVGKVGSVPNQPQLGQAQNQGSSKTSPKGGGAKRVSGTQSFVRAEVEKRTVFKGEQVVVSYYLYHQTRIFNLQVSRFPVLNGFLREDLDIPAMGQPLISEPFMMNGENYERTLLAKYAAYPLQDGKLEIDAISLKYQYYDRAGGSPFDEEDPFFGFSFFQQLAPRLAQAKSDIIELTVLPLPSEGKPSTFGGGVGEFTVTSAVNKYEVKANEAVNLTVKIEGHGNVSSIQEPKVKWPENIELYDAKGKSQTSKSGLGEKVFEFLLIPRVAGTIQVPAIEFSFFDPVNKKYYSKSTEPVALNVLAPMPGTDPALSSKKLPQSEKQDFDVSSQGSQEQLSPSPIKASSEKESKSKFITWERLSRASTWMAVLGVLSFFLVVLFDVFQKRRRAASATSNTKGMADQKVLHQLEILSQSMSNGATWIEVVQAYNQLSELILGAIDSKFHVGAKGLSRDSLQQVLVSEKGVSETVWQQTARLLDFVDLVRFSSQAGGVSEAQARTDLSKWVKEANLIIKEMDRAGNSPMAQL